MAIDSELASPAKVEKPETMEDGKEEQSPLKPATNLSLASATRVDPSEADVLPDMLPLMRKKTTVVQSMGDKKIRR